MDTTNVDPSISQQDSDIVISLNEDVVETTADTFHVLAKNARINSLERLSILLTELSSLSWSVCCFAETRRLSGDIYTSGGHRLISSLSVSSYFGVTILIHQKYIKDIKKIK